MIIKKIFYKYNFLFLVIFVLQSCGGGSGGTSVPTSDVTPDTLGFDSIANVELNTLTVSTIITISGIDSAAPISIIGGEYSINGDSFTDVNGTISNGQAVQVRQTSSNSTLSTTDVTLTVGGLSGKFSITTRATLPSPEIIVSPASLNLTESALKSPIISGFIKVRLNTKPTGSVVISATSLNTTIAVVNPTFAAITFDASDWNVDKSIPISSIDDAIAGGARTTSITVVASNVGNSYDNLSASVGVIVADDDTADIIIKVAGSSTLVLGSVKERLSKNFTVQLNSEPLTDITLKLISDSPRATVKNSVTGLDTIVFKSTVAGDWKTSQDIIVTAVDDGVANGDLQIKINVTVITGDTTGYAGLTKAVTAKIIDIQVADPDGFLQFLNKSAPRNNELTGNKVPVGGVDAGLAYYKAVDPGNQRLTLSAFKTFNNNLSDTPNAIYVNNADLGFARRMYLTTSLDGTVASCVENFAPVVNGKPNVDASAAVKIALAKAVNGTTPTSTPVAVVCMEYSGTPGSATTVGGLTGRKFVKFFSYAGDGTRITEADLDGRGLKTQPGVCNTCHGGQGNSLQVNGVYPLLGDTDAKFLPWDLENFLFDTAAGFTRVDLEPLFKIFNQGVLATYPIPTSYQTTTPVNIPVNSNTGISTITVPATAPDTPITSIVISIDETLQGGAGLTLTDINGFGVGYYLTSPAGRVYNLTFTQKSNTKVTEVRNLFITDVGSSVTYNVIGNVGTGTLIAHDTGGFINNRGACISATPVAQTSNELGCTSPRGAWKLKVVTNGCAGPNINLCQPPLGYTGTLSAWSIHFNGIPEQAYLPAPVDLIRGWYAATPGDTTLSGSFNAKFIPDGWKFVNNSNAVADTDLLYLNVIAPTCRSCHIQRGSLSDKYIDFSSYSNFMQFKNSTKNLVYEKGLMPLAKRTYENYFWKPAVAPGVRQADILAIHMPGYVANQSFLTPGRNVANAGLARVVSRGTEVLLSGEASLFPARINNRDSYEWTITSPLGAKFTLVGKNVSFIATELGDYRVSLDTSGGLARFQNAPLTKSDILVSSLDTITPISFRNDVVAVLSTCTGTLCHGGFSYKLKRSEGRIRLGESKFISTAIKEAELQEIYKSIRERVNTFNPLESELIRKNNLELTHAGGSEWEPYRLSNIQSVKDGYDIVVRWILEGAKNN